MPNNEELKTLYKVCAHLNNFFIEAGAFVLDITDNQFEFNLPNRTNANMFLVERHGFFMFDYDEINHVVTCRDAVHPLSVFDARVSLCSLPAPFIELVKDIHSFSISEEGQPSSIISERLVAAYQYQKAITDKGLPATWHNIFKKDLDSYRRLFTGVLV